ncbi:hypothetical protein D3C85_1810990 [compost metagenome]
MRSSTAGAIASAGSALEASSSLSLASDHTLCQMSSMLAPMWSMRCCMRTSGATVEVKGVAMSLLSSCNPEYSRD